MANMIKILLLLGVLNLVSSASDWPVSITTTTIGAVSTTTTKPSPAESEKKSCAKIDKGALEKKFTVAMVKSVEKLFKGEISRRRLSSSGQWLASSIHEDDQLGHIFHKPHHARSHPGQVASSRAETILSRSRRFCVPVSYGESVKNLVERIVANAFQEIKL